MNLFALAVILLSFIATCAGEVDLSKGKLIAASVIFRHGDRTPVEPYPNDPYKDPKFWPTGFGQLTNTGKNQHFEHGKWLRQRYNDLVGEKYNFEEMRVRSTDVDRTLMSAQSNLAGFYPPKANDVWNTNLDWQPIPIHTIPEDMDELLAAKKPCQVYDVELNKLNKSPEFREYQRKYKPLFDYLTKNTGRTVDSIQSVQYIYSCLHIEDIYNFTLPEWTKSVYPDQLSEVSGLSFAYKTYTPLLARLKSGPLLKEILMNFDNKSLSKEKTNLWIYSAHDTTVANMLNTLGVFKAIGYHNPPYTATVMFELREINQQFFVQVFYKNSTGEPMLLNLPGCGQNCVLEQMFDVYKDVIPKNWEKECHLSMLQLPLNLQVDESLSQLAIFGFIALMCIVGMFVLLIATIYKKRSDYLSEYKWNQMAADWS